MIPIIIVALLSVILNIALIYTMSQLRAKLTERDLTAAQELAQARREIQAAKEKMEQSIAQSENQLRQLAKQQEERNQTLQFLQVEIAAKMKEATELNAALAATKKSHSTTVAEQNAIAAQLKKAQAELARIQEDRDRLSQALESLRNQHSIATKLTDYSSIGRVLAHGDLDVQAHQVLDSLKQQYPQLREAFSNVQWTHIWQKKFQAMTTDIQKKTVCGIYRIFTIGELGRQRSYIGQARDIRERWSQHIKKMCGTLIADNQKFYSNVTPYNAHFEIIEECSESELNDKEHYWISYYNGVSDGYNSRT